MTEGATYSLYEMLAGKRAFEGKSQLSVASAILEKEPEAISSSKPLTPSALEHVVKKCLAKAPEERWQSASDLSSELKWIAESGSQLIPPAMARTKEIRSLWRAATMWTALSISSGRFQLQVKT